MSIFKSHQTSSTIVSVLANLSSAICFYLLIDYSITLFSLVKHKFLNVLFCTSSANQHRAQFFSFSSRVWKIYFFCIFLHFNPKIITERSQEENQLEETVLLMKFFFFFSPTRTTTTFSSRTPLFVLTFSLRIPKTQKITELHRERPCNR